MTSKYFREPSFAKFRYETPPTQDVIYINQSNLHDTKVSRIYSNDLKSLTFPGQVQFEDTISKNLFNKGEIFKVLFIEEDHFIIEGHIHCKYNQHLVWKNAIQPVLEPTKTIDTIAYEQDPVIAEPIKYSKKQIPKAVKSHIWDHYIGRHINEHRCLCCKKAYIRNMDFVTGHVISESNGGTLEINNLRPICAVCNHGMGQMNMIDYVKKYGYYI